MPWRDRPLPAPASPTYATGGREPKVLYLAGRDPFLEITSLIPDMAAKFIGFGGRSAASVYMSKTPPPAQRVSAYKEVRRSFGLPHIFFPFAVMPVLRESTCRNLFNCHVLFPLPAGWGAPAADVLPRGFLWRPSLEAIL